MLRYEYSLNASTNVQEVALDDMFVSPDLSCISGTTTDTSLLTQGDSVWIKSEYFPRDTKMPVKSKRTVVRNGYVLIPNTVQIQYATSHYNGETGTSMPYVEIGGNTYYASLGEGTYTIEGNEYTPSGSFLTFPERHYIEDGKLEYDGKSYNATVNKEGKLFLSNQQGVPFIIPDTWDTGNVSYESTTVSEFVIGENIPMCIDCREASYYGHMAYVIYGGEKFYIHYFKDANGNVTGAGVTVSGVDYPCSAISTEYEGGGPMSFNIYNRNLYYENEYGNCVMSVAGEDCIIHFEPSRIDGSGIIGIETVDEYPPIMISDRIIVKTTGPSNTVRLMHDDDGKLIAYVGGRKLRQIRNLCDYVELGNDRYTIVYDEDCEHPTSGICHIRLTDGTKVYFRYQASDVVNDSVRRLKRVEFDGTEWKECYMMKQGTGSTVNYVEQDPYDVVNVDGIKVGDYNAPIEHYSASIEDGELDDDYYYITVNNGLEYTLKVIDTVGSNRILCIPDVDNLLYDSGSTIQLAYEILSSISDNDFVVKKRNSSFGVVDLYYDTWLSEAAKAGGGVSSYELADIRNNIKITAKSPFFKIPITLYGNTCNRMSYDDLVRSVYYSEEADKAINRLVDMEKDVYRPVYKDNGNVVDITAIEFNMHFRTRDLDTWKIIEDEGTVTSNNSELQLSANYQYCNWFVTDFWPYNRTGFGQIKSDISDALGLMYFTDDDIRYKREKLLNSFLRLTFYDSRNPSSQNMLGTSTLHFDIDRLLNILYIPIKSIEYWDIIKTTKDVDTIYDMPNVKRQSMGRLLGQLILIPSNKYMLNSHIEVNNLIDSQHSSEGFLMYILKEFGDKKKDKTIYMKAEFFHAGLGIKVPMTLPSRSDGTPIARESWDNQAVDEMKGGQNLDKVFNSIYIPITISYSKEKRSFVYTIGNGDGNNDPYMKAVKSGNRLIFDLFELKIKP